MTSKSIGTTNLSTQEHCIDLPGESVRCWIGGGADKLRVTLRKHRDVVFDISLGKGKTYSLEASDSDFYSVRDKKIVKALKKEKIQFHDDERIHVWISRGFRGKLTVKCGDQTIHQIQPNELDRTQISSDPSEKLAPIIVTMGAPEKSIQRNDIAKENTPPSESSTNHLHIVEATKKDSPPAILKFFEDGGESLKLDEHNIVTRNWLIGQFSGVIGYALDNKAWINELEGCKFYLQKVKHPTGTKVYIIFNGNNKLRSLITASRYGINNHKIIQITGGGGNAKQAWTTAKNAAKDSLKVVSGESGSIKVKGGGLVVFLSMSMDVAEWYKDYSEVGTDGKPKKDIVDLAAKLGIDLVKAGLVAALTSAALSLLFSAIVATGMVAGVPIAIVVVGSLVVSAFFAFQLEKADKAAGKSLGSEETTAWVAEKMRAIGNSLEKNTRDEKYEGYAEMLMSL